jgi:hypothetical protein
MPYEDPSVRKSFVPDWNILFGKKDSCFRITLIRVIGATRKYLAFDI